MIKPIIFLGPPGTGKTTALLNVVEREMENGVPPDRIGYMTFTKRGVEEAISRAASRFNLPRSRFRYFNTLHSAAFRQLDLKTDEVFTGKRIYEFGREYGYDLHGGLSSDDGTYSSFYGDDIVLFFENISRITRQPFELILKNNDYLVPDYIRALEIVKNFRGFKARKHLLDFTDMIEQFIDLDEAPLLEVLIVDEAQDLSELQWAMVVLLARHVKRMYVAGDDDQTIYTWAGASERFISMPGDVDVLKQSYRVPIKIQDLANRVISTISNRREKVWLPRQAEGSVSWVPDIAALNPTQCNSGKSVMMLGRTVKLIKHKYIPYCRAHGLLYKYFDANSIKPSIATAITAWNRLKEGEIISATDAVKIYNLLPSESHAKKPGIAYGCKTKLGRLAEIPDETVSLQELKHNYGLNVDGAWNQVFQEIVNPNDLDYIKKVIDNGTKLTDKPNIHISTIHRVKGGQADKVVLLSETAKLSDKFAVNQDEETRVFYTGITRAYEDLILVQPERRYHFEPLFQ